MIRTDTEYETTAEHFRQGEEYLRREREALAATGRTPDEIKRLTDPAACFQAQLRDELAFYERVRSDDFEGAKRFQGGFSPPD